MGVEEAALLSEIGRSSEASSDEAGHHLAERGDVVFRLLHVVGAGDAQARHVVAQPRQRLLVQEPGQIVGGVGQQLALADADEEVEVLPPRSEEHTSELQSLMRTSYADFCLKNKNN